MITVTTDFILEAMRDGGRLKEMYLSTYATHKRLVLIYKGVQYPTQHSRIMKLKKAGFLYPVWISYERIEYVYQEPSNEPV